MDSEQLEKWIKDLQTGITDQRNQHIMIGAAVATIPALIIYPLLLWKLAFPTIVIAGVLGGIGGYLAKNRWQAVLLGFLALALPIIAGVVLVIIIALVFGL